jgi:hypothetical protein
MTAMHYAGSLVYRTSTGVVTILPGWAACCSGPMAVKIRSDGNNTYDRDKVTCKTCLLRLSKELRR